MLISEHIEALQKLLKEEGDKELFIWVDEGDEFLYPVKMPAIKVENICCNEYQIKPEFRDDKNGGSILIVTNLDTSSFNRDEDDVQDLELEIIDVDEVDNVDKGIENV